MKDNRGSSIQTASNEVVLSVLSEGSDSSSDSFGIKIEKKEPNDSAIASSKREYYAQNTDMPPEVPKFSPASFTRRRPVITRAFSKSKSRFVEPTYPSEPDLAFQSNQGVLNALPRASMHTLKPTSIIPNTALADLERDEEDDFEDVYISNILRANHVPRYLQKTSVFTLVELLLFLSLTGLLVASLIDYDLQETSIWNLVLWKWCVLFIVAFSGRLITEWIIELIVCLVKRRLFFKKKVRYFVYGVKNSLQVCLWLSFVLVAWILLVIRGSKRSSKTTRVLHYITFGIAGCLVGAGIWLIKTLLIKILGVSFHVKRFFDRIQESLFNQYVLHTLSGPPLMEKRVARSRNCSRLSLERKTKDKRVKQDVINVEKLQKMNQEKVSAWTMKGLIKVTRRSNLSTMSNTLDLNEGEEIVEKNNEIKSEREAKLAAVKIFHRVAKPGYAFIEEEDLLRFMNVDEVSQAFPLFDGAIETGKITKSSLNKWVVNAYMERKSLAHSLNDTKTVVDELNSLASVLVTIVIVIVWNLIMGFLTTKILLFLISQLLLLAFVFGNSVKTIFEAIIFIFVMHPFDVGDRCVIDDVQMVVEEMNILTTIFLRYDNEKISYPNSVLANKPISNFYRSPEMIDSVEFAIDFATKVEHIAGLKERIESYIESKPQHWKPSHSVQLKEIVDMNKIVMTLYVTHTINFQNIVEKGNRRSDLVLELKKIFEELGIKYHLLPQDIHVKYVGSLAAAAIAQS